MSIFNPAAKLLYHTERISQWLYTDKTKPILIEIAPAGYCNASCPWCFFNNKKEKKLIESNLMFKALKDLSSLGLKAINWSGGGEPTLHPEFSAFVGFAAKLGLKQGLFTNGYLEIPNQNKFEWIRISLTEKGFEKIIKPKVPFGICVNHTSSYYMYEIEDMCMSAKKFGASYFQIRPALINSYDKQPRLDPPVLLKKYSDKNFKVYVTDYKYTEAIKPKEYKDCYGYHFVPSIDWNGHLLVCLYLSGNDNFILGDLNKEDVKSIWKGMKNSFKVIKQCQNCCKNHEINKILYAVKHIEQKEFL